MARRGVRIAAVSGLAAAGLLLASVPVRAEIAHLTSLPLGKGTATVTWAGTSGISPNLNSVSGSARGLPIAATGTVHTPSPGSPLSSTIPFLKYLCSMQQSALRPLPVPEPLTNVRRLILGCKKLREPLVLQLKELKTVWAPRNCKIR